MLVLELGREVLCGLGRRVGCIVEDQVAAFTGQIACNRNTDTYRRHLSAWLCSSRSETYLLKRP
jgi:hypothetical protein